MAFTDDSLHAFEALGLAHTTALAFDNRFDMCRVHMGEGGKADGSSS